MKKILLTVFALLGTYSLTFAQNFWDGSSSKFEFGANVGYNVSYVTVGASSLSTYSYTAGFNAAVSADMALSDRWSIKAKLIYDQKGWGDDLYYQAGLTTSNYTYHLNYVTLPIMANWHFGRTRHWYLNFGPYAGFLISAKETTTNTDVKSSFNNKDFGLAAGIGYKFEITDNIKLFIESDGQSGVTNIFKQGLGTSYQNVRSSFNVGVNFSL